jgi:hypothetical protein
VKDIERFIKLQKDLSGVNPSPYQGGKNGGNGSVSDMPDQAVVR